MKTKLHALAGDAEKAEEARARRLQVERRLAEATEPVPVPPPSGIPESGITCPSCGLRVDEDDEVCLWCGAGLGSVQAALPRLRSPAPSRVPSTPSPTPSIEPPSPQVEDIVPPPQPAAAEAAAPVPEVPQAESPEAAEQEDTEPESPAPLPVGPHGPERAPAGLTNGLARERRGTGRTNGLARATTGRTNGMTNGLANSFRALRSGMTNGLTNGSGFTNGLGTPQFHREGGVSRWKVYLIPGLAAVLLILPLFGPGDATGRPITIDGDASDWPSPLVYAQSLGGPNPNVDVTRFGVADNVDGLAILIEVAGAALQGGGTPPTMDAFHVFLDADGDVSTGYAVDGLGAEALVRISGWGGSANVSATTQWDDAFDPTDWRGWRDVPVFATSVSAAGRIEAQVDWLHFGGTRGRAFATVHARGFDGATDRADFALNVAGGSLVVRQTPVVPATLSAGTVTLLRLEATALGADARWGGLSVTLTGSAPFLSTPQLRILDAAGGVLDVRTPLDRRVSFQFETTIPTGTTASFEIVADTVAAGGTTLGALVADAGDVIAAGSVITLQRSAAPREVGYVGSPPTDPRIDGGFDEWRATDGDPAGDVTRPHRPDVDVASFGAQSRGNASYFFAEVTGRFFRGAWVIEPNGLATSAGAPLDGDRDGVPDAVDPLPADFNNDGIPDASSGGDVDADGVVDHPFGGTDWWLNATIPAAFPAPYSGTNVSVYVGPIERPYHTRDDILRVFADLDNSSASGYAVGGLGADRMVELAGKSGLVRSAGLFAFGGAFPGQWSWVPAGAASFAVGFNRTEFASPENVTRPGSRLYVEIAEPMGGRDVHDAGTRGTRGSSVEATPADPSSFDVAPMPTRAAWDARPATRASTLVDGSSNAISTEYNHQRKVVRAGDVPGDTACNLTNSDGCWYSVFSDQSVQATSNTQASTESIVAGSKISGTFPTDIQTENAAYIQYRETGGFLAKAGAFNIGTGGIGTTVQVSSVGFQPKVVLLWSTGRTTSTDSAGGGNHQRGFGVAVSTTDRRTVCSSGEDGVTPGSYDGGTRHHADAAICSSTTGGGVDGLADFSSWDADGFTLVIDDVFLNNLRIHYLALGGSVLTNVATGMFTESATTGNQDVTTVGFQPDAVVLFSAMIGADPPGQALDTTTMIGFAAGAGNPNDVVWAGAAQDSPGTIQTISYHRAGESVALFDAAGTLTDGRAEVDAWLVNGFSLNWNERFGSRRIHYLALKGGNYVVGDLTTSTTGGATVAESGFGFSPKASLFLSHNKVQSTVDTVQANDELSLGAFSSTTSRGAQCLIDVDGVGTSVIGTAVEHDEVYCNVSTARAVEGLMGIQSVDSGGFTLVMDDPDPAASFVGYIALGGSSTMEVRYDWSGVPAGDSYTLQVKGYRQDENVYVQVLTPPTTWNSRLLISATTNTMYTVSLTTAEYASGAPAVRFVDADPTDGTQSDFFIDFANVATNSHWDRVILMRSADTSGSTWGSQVILASGNSADSPLLYSFDSAEPSIAIDASGFLHVVWASAASPGNQATLNRVRYTKTTVAYPTQVEIASAGNWEPVTTVDESPNTKVGAFNIGTGGIGATIPVTGVGFQPKVVLLWWSGRTTGTDSAGTATHQRGFGVAVSTADRRAVCSQSQDAQTAGVGDKGHQDAAAICSLTTAGAFDGLADLSSMDADGFTLVIDDPFLTDLRIHYLALGGSSLTDAKTGMFIESATTGNQDITTVGFQPDAVILFSSRSTFDPPGADADSSLMVGFAAGAGNPSDMVLTGGSNDASDPTQTATYHRAGESIAVTESAVTVLSARAEVDAWLSNGFSLNWNEVIGVRRFHYLALKGGSYIVGDLTTSTTGGATIAESGFGFSPQASLFLSHNKVQSTVDTLQAHDEMSIGAFSSADNRGAQCLIDEDAVADSDVGTAVEHDEVYCNLDANTAIEGLMDIQSVDSGGFTLVMDDPDPAASFVGYMAFGGLGAAATYPGYMPTVSTDTSNNPHIAWSASKTSGTVYYRNKAAGTWRSFVSWGTTYTGLSVDVSPQNNYVSLARYLEAGTNEIQYTVCKDLSTSNCDVSAEFTKADGTAGSDTVATAVETASYPSLATTHESNGDLWVAYAKDVDGTTRAIYARFLDYPSGGWQPPTTVDSLSGTIFTRPSIGIDKDNNVHALYVSTATPQVYYNKRSGGAWGTRTPVEQSTSDNPTFAVRAPNDATYGSDMGGLYFQRFSNATYFYYQTAAIPEYGAIAIPILGIVILSLWRRWTRTTHRRGRVSDASRP